MLSAGLVTVANDCFFSNKLDIGKAGTSRARLLELVDVFHPLVPTSSRALPMPTVASQNMQSLFHDFRLMREDSGVL